MLSGCYCASYQPPPAQHDGCAGRRTINSAPHASSPPPPSLPLLSNSHPLPRLLVITTIAMASVCPPPFVLPPALPPTLPPTLPPSLPPFPQRRIRLLVPAEPHFIPPAIGLLLAQSEQYPALRRHAAARTPLTYPLRAAVMDELTQLESDLYAWSGDEALWAWLQSVHAEHSE